jgi:dihydropteroate synthase
MTLDAIGRTSPCQIMGILNVTPDSFSDGGHYCDSESAVDAASVMVAEGAEMIDVGGESTRPGAEPVSEAEELRRVIPVVRAIRARHATIPISVDTQKAQVAQEALDVGATIVNDVSAGEAEPDILSVVAAHGAVYILMHRQGLPKTMQEAPCYTDVVHEVSAYLARRVSVAVNAGIDPAWCLVDPGIGFGKTMAHNVALLQHLRDLTPLGGGVALGVSRKSMIGELLGGAEVTDRLEGGLAIAAHALQQGVRILRVHDVAATRKFLTVWKALAVTGFRPLATGNR